MCVCGVVRTLGGVAPPTIDVPVLAAPALDERRWCFRARGLVITAWEDLKWAIIICTHFCHQRGKQARFLVLAKSCGQAEDLSQYHVGGELFLSKEKWSCARARFVFVKQKMRVSPLRLRGPGSARIELQTHLISSRYASVACCLAGLEGGCLRVVERVEHNIDQTIGEVNQH